MSDKDLRKQLEKDEQLRLRKLIMSNPSLVRELVITEDQQELLKLVVNRYEISARDAADKFKISIQSASSRLNALAKKGYLVRRKSFHGSGGLEYYYMTFQRKEYLESIPKQNRSLRSG